MTPITSYYLERVLTPEGLRDAVTRVVRVLREDVKLNTFDAIAFRGVSGALVAPAVAVAVGKPLIVVRKSEASHGRPVEGAITAKRYVIVDDFVGAGGTVRAITDALDGTLRGVVTYNGNSADVDHSSWLGWEA